MKNKRLLCTQFLWVSVSLWLAWQLLNFHFVNLRFL